jgi:hypothetical protein
MYKAEPKTILSFLSTYFDTIRELFDAQSKEGIIRKEVLDLICSRAGTNIKSQLKEYKLLKSSNEDFEIREVYYKLLEFLLLEFKPLLPETIEKYHLAISELFRKIKDGINGDENILLERLHNLTLQIREFTEAVEKNTLRLLEETRALKANDAKLDYKLRVQKASFWIDYYILPLNRILDVAHSESVTNKLLDISEYANEKRLNFIKDKIEKEFGNLYHQLHQTNKDLLTQSKLLINELLPLIERIKTESLILSGWIKFLDNPYKFSPALFMKNLKDSPYSKTILANSREYFEQFGKEDSVFIETETSFQTLWIFQKEKYKSRLKARLPVDDFFHWCLEALNDEGEITSEKFFAITSLLFEDDISPEFDAESRHSKIKTANAVFLVPKLNIKQNGLPKKS